MFRSLRLSHLLIGSATLVAASLAPTSALAQTTASETSRVTQLFKSGKAAFAKGDMAEAERLFADAFAIRKSSDIAANLGQSELEQQKFTKAAEHFQWALANLLPSATDAQRKAVETGLARSRTEVAVLRLDIKPEGSDVLVGDQSLGKSPISGGIYVNPGEVIVSVRHEGFIALDKRVLAGKGTEQAIEVSLTPRDGAAVTGAPAAAETGPAAVDSGLEHPAPAAATSDVPAAKPKSLVPAFVATGVAVAGGVTGLVLMVTASSRATSADNTAADLNAQGGCDPTSGTAPRDQCDALTSDRKSIDLSRNIAVGAFVVGGVAALAAGYFYWDALAHHGSEQARQRRPLFGITPRVDVSRAREGAVDSVRLGLSGTF